MVVANIYNTTASRRSRRVKSLVYFFFFNIADTSFYSAFNLTRLVLLCRKYSYARYFVVCMYLGTIWVEGGGGGEDGEDRRGESL